MYLQCMVVINLETRTPCPCPDGFCSGSPHPICALPSPTLPHAQTPPLQAKDERLRELRAALGELEGKGSRSEAALRAALEQEGQQLAEARLQLQQVCVGCVCMRVWHGAEGAGMISIVSAPANAIDWMQRPAFTPVLTHTTTTAAAPRITSTPPTPPTHTHTYTFHPMQERQQRHQAQAEQAAQSARLEQAEGQLAGRLEAAASTSGQLAAAQRRVRLLTEQVGWVWVWGAHTYIYTSGRVGGGGQGCQSADELSIG